jgi:hypothetical protein
MNFRQMMCGNVNWIRFSRGSAQRQTAVNTNEHPGPIRNNEFFDSLANCQFLKDFTPCSYVFFCGIRLAEKSHFKNLYCACSHYICTKPAFGARRYVLNCHFEPQTVPNGRDRLAVTTPRNRKMFMSPEFRIFPQWHVFILLSSGM